MQGTMKPSITQHEVEARFTSDQLDFDYIDEVAYDIAWALRSHRAVEAAYQPGDGTFYGLVFTPLYTLLTARERVKDGVGWDRHACRGQRFEPSGRYSPGGFLVSYIEHAAYPIRLGDRDEIAADYISEHFFDGKSAESAVSVAILLRAISWWIDQGALEIPEGVEPV